MNADRIIKKIIELEADVRDIKEHMSTRDDIRDIQSTLDTIVGLIQRQDTEVTMMQHGTARTVSRVDGLEERVTSLQQEVILLANK